MSRLLGFKERYARPLVLEAAQLCGIEIVRVGFECQVEAELALIRKSRRQRALEQLDICATGDRGEDVQRRQPRAETQVAHWHVVVVGRTRQDGSARTRPQTTVRRDEKRVERSTARA